MQLNLIASIVLTAVAAGLYVEPAWAYIDPNSGGIIFQLLVPVFAAIVAFWTYLRSRIAGAFRSMSDRLFGRRKQ